MENFGTAKRFIAALVILGGAVWLQAEEFRTFTNSSGRKIEASVVGVKGDQVKIVMRDHRSFVVPVSSLSAEDQTFLKQWSESANKPKPVTDAGGITYEALNQVAGSPIFGEVSLWDSNPSGVADRLGWKRESKTSFSESYRNYPDEKERIFGARPYSVALYGENEKVTGISIVYANKGDSFSEGGGRGEKHFIDGKPIPGGMEGVRVLMENDTKVVTEKLSSILGEPKKQKFGEGEARVNALRWDWAGHALLLSEVEDEYVSLSIQTTEFADKRGQAARVSDASVRNRIRGLIEKRDNGDVVISNIPMVDQGPKGYCVPATAERCMRFLGIPADMYLLAMTGETKAGGGTSVDLLLSNIGRDIKRKGRSFDIETGELKLRDIKKRVDKGIPTIWGLFSTKQFNDIANERTKQRKTDDWSSYVATVQQESKDAVLQKDRNTAHVVIIMGYNEQTGEIAFSDSWGERYKERWITVKEAQQISQNRFYIIDL